MVSISVKFLIHFCPDFEQKMTKKNKKISVPTIPKTEPFASLLNGLIYISETDAEIVPFTGDNAPAVSSDEIRRQTGTPADVAIETIDARQFFDRLTQIKDWFGDAEKKRAGRFAELRNELMAKLKDVKVFRVGEIRIDIYIVGIDAGGRLAGVKTKAVET